MADISSFDLNLLRVFDTLMREKNVSRAAEKLHLTQPTVSGMLGRLRESLDDPLFIRQQRGMIPTPRAETLAPQISRALAEIEAAIAPVVFDPKRSERTFRIAATDYAEHTLFAPLLKELAAKAPKMRIAIIPTDPDRIRSDLESGDLDLWISLPESAGPALKMRKLYSESYVCAVRHGHPEAGNALSLQSFLDARHIVVSPSGGGFQGAVDTALQAIGQTRFVAYSANSFAIVPDLLEQSDCISVLPERMVRDRKRICALQPPIELEGFTLAAFWHERFHHDPAHRWFREKLRDL
ncbi:LysR family transcriptional regulator [Tropicimonas sp. S265A]|uniref:LysR family transcriptional regulator n=1 Tax=Tropicimonas sp. S265A TaxID=3415134 RepID=UPI003C7A7F1D